MKKWLVNPESPVDNSELTTVHSNNYLEFLRFSQYVSRALELPPLAILPNWLVDKFVLEPMRWATKGTILMAENAIKNGIGVNLSGGYHHASSENGEGFCIYSDIAIAIALLRKQGMLLKGDKVLIIDLDAHQGNGLERIFINDEDVKIFDIYNQDIYPRDSFAQKRIDYDIPLHSRVKDKEYLGLLEKYLPAFLTDFSDAKLAFYNAGTDIYEFDPLGNLGISAQGILTRDKFVFNTLTNTNIPWVMVLSGGYTRESHQFIAESIAYILQTWGLEEERR